MTILINGILRNRAKGALNKEILINEILRNRAKGALNKEILINEILRNRAKGALNKEILINEILRNRAKGALNKEILDLLNEDSISGACSGSITLTRSLLRVFEKVSQPLKCHSNFLGGHIHIYVHIYT